MTKIKRFAVKLRREFEAEITKPARCVNTVRPLTNQQKEPALWLNRFYQQRQKGQLAQYTDGSQKMPCAAL
jgi:hypothetical protein